MFSSCFSDDIKISLPSESIFLLSLHELDDSSEILGLIFLMPVWRNTLISSILVPWILERTFILVPLSLFDRKFLKCFRFVTPCYFKYCLFIRLWRSQKNGLWFYHTVCMEVWCMYVWFGACRMYEWLVCCLVKPVLLSRFKLMRCRLIIFKHKRGLGYMMCLEH